MAVVGSTLLKLLQTIFYAILFACAAVILSIYSYFLATLANNDVGISSWKKAVEGISGAACVYLITAVVFTIFLGGVKLFAFVAIVVDILFAGGFIAIAVLTRDGVQSCSGSVVTPIGNGPSDRDSIDYGSNNYGLGDVQGDYDPNLGLACILNKVVFAVAVIGAVFFLVCAALQVAIARKHQSDKRYGPSPANGYTSGTGKRRFWQRAPPTASPSDAEVYHAKRSVETGYTGTTAAPASTTTYESSGTPISSGYYTAPTGTHASPAPAGPYGSTVPTGTHGTTAPTRHYGSSTNY